MKTVRLLRWCRHGLRVRCCIWFGFACIPGLSLQAQNLADDLCDYQVEGLSLASSKADLDAKFAAMGWHASSQSDVDIRTRKTESRFTYTRLPPEVIPPDGFRPGEREPRYDSTFTMLVVDGQPDNFSYGHHVQSEPDFARMGLAGPLERAQQFCALNDSRFVLTGCNRVYRGANVMSLTLLPAARTGSYCRVNLNAQEGSSFAYSVNRISETQSRMLQDRQNRLNRPTR